MLEDLFKLVKLRLEYEKENKKKNKFVIPSDLLFKCPRCYNIIFKEEFESNFKVCVECNYHSRLSAKERLDITIDKDSLLEYDSNMTSKNPINFPGYEDKIKEIQNNIGLNDAVVTGECTINYSKAIIIVMDSRFMMASMGSVVGEKITRAFERACEKKLPVVLFAASGGARMQEGVISLMQMAKTSAAVAKHSQARAFERACEKKLPVVLFAASGGARMQEGVISLMQMAKTSAAVAKHSQAGLLYITVITDPTTGGVTASFASLGDIIIAEPKVLIGFAGRRVIESTIKQRLPDDFQSSEFLLSHGFIDMIVDRKELKNTISSLIELHNNGGEINE